MQRLLKPKEVTITDVDGILHTYTVSRLPATVGRRVIIEYTSAALPKRDGSVDDTMRLLMRYVGKWAGDAFILLETDALLDNHVPDGEALLRLEMEAMKHNVSFFQGAGSSAFMDSLLERWEAIAPKIIPTLTNFLQSLSAQISQHSRS